MSVVTISYDSLVSNVDLSVDVLKAYGSDGYGVLTISDIPRYKELRERLLPLSHKLAHLPQETLSKYEDEISLWNSGWSYGKEKLGDVPDLAKGSYYANPIYDEATTEEDRKIHPTFYPKNIWPTDDLPELEVAFKELGKVMYDTSVLLSRQIDLVVSRIIPGYEKNLLNREIGKTKKIKGRLLYYYPTESTDTDDGWIGWHNDSGFLTALTAAMFFDDTTGEIIPNPDPTGGLWIVDRGHSPIKAVIPPNNLAIQCGECLQIVTGGVFVATPHCVKASKAPIGKKVGRGTFPVFIDTGMDFLLSAPKGTNRESVFDKTVHSKVPPLQNRWIHDGQPFQQFLHETFERYYNWNFM